MYHELTSRNSLFLKPELQEKIRGIPLVFAGCGLSSVIAVTAARLGFTRFVFVDGDSVEQSNLNRQYYFSDQINQKKVVALKESILKINPECCCECISRNLSGKKEIFSLLQKGNILINTIDCGPLYFDLVEEAQKAGVHVFCPFNPGFGSLVVYFHQHSISLYEFLGTNVPLTDLDFCKAFLEKYPEIKLLDDLGLELSELDQTISSLGFEPQCVIGVQETSNMVCYTLLKLLKGESIPAAPAILYHHLGIL